MQIRLSCRMMLTGLSLLVIGLFLFNLLWGVFPLPYSALWGAATPGELQILTDLRLPRAVAALAVGGALALSGASLQLLLGNPLAEPGLLGISGGASLFSAAAIVLFEFSSPAIEAIAIAIFAFAGALTVTAILFIVAKRYYFQGSQLLLLGVAIGMLSSAGITWFFLYADDKSLRELLYWSMGSFSMAVQLDYYYLIILVPLLSWVILQASRLNLLLMGEKSAFSLGLDINKLRPKLILAIALMVGICVALCGVIGFVGLLIPHLLRLVIGNDQRILMPSSALAGGAMMLFADSLSRNLLQAGELPVGIITSTVGVPIFIMILVKRRAGR